MEFSRPLLNRLILGRRPELKEKLRKVSSKELKPRSIDANGNSLLHLALFENQKECVQDLLDYGLSPHLNNRWGLSPTDLAHFLGNDMILPLLGKIPKPPSITIFRNSDQKKHLISLAEFEKKIGIEYIDYLEFEHPDYLKWTLWKSERHLRKDRVRKMNRWILALHKKSIEIPRHDHIYIRHVTRSIGYGVFANRDLAGLTYIGEYTGLVTRRHSKKTRFNDYVFGYMAGPKETPFIIDAHQKGNFTRFINHSDDPNLNSRWVVHKGITRIILFANRLIKKDEQLTYDYGKYYWRRRLGPKTL